MNPILFSPAADGMQSTETLGLSRSDCEAVIEGSVYTAFSPDKVKLTHSHPCITQRVDETMRALLSRQRITFSETTAFFRPVFSVALRYLEKLRHCVTVTCKRRDCCFIRKMIKCSTWPSTIGAYTWLPSKPRLCSVILQIFHK